MNEQTLLTVLDVCFDDGRITIIHYVDSRFTGNDLACSEIIYNDGYLSGDSIIGGGA